MNTNLYCEHNNAINAHHINTIAIMTSDKINLLCSYLKTSIPHPATAVNNLGPRSLAGFSG